MAHRKRCEYVECGQMFKAAVRARRYCSRRCSTKARQQVQPDFYRTIGHKGGSQRGVRLDRTLEGRLRAKLGPSATLADAYRFARQNARRSTYGNGYRAGYARGWSEAIGERWTGDRVT